MRRPPLHHMPAPPTESPDAGQVQSTRGSIVVGKLQPPKPGSRTGRQWTFFLGGFVMTGEAGILDWMCQRHWISGAFLFGRRMAF